MIGPSIAYVNGQFVPIAEAHVSVLDRGFLFADGVYEVSAVIGGQLVDNAAHLARLRRSLRELDMTAPLPLGELPPLMNELIQREALDEGLVYLQITRGANSQRDFGYPDPRQVPSTLVMFAQQKALVDNPLAQSGGKAITIPDIRWKRRDIKSIALLPQAMGKQLAVQTDAIEAFLVEDGYITEATAAAVGIITADKTLVTHPPTADVLDSVTRRATLGLVASTGLQLAERPFTPAEAYQADEVFITSATALVTPIIEIDAHPIGTGRPGRYAQQLRARYLQEALAGRVQMTEYDYSD